MTSTTVPEEAVKAALETWPENGTPYDASKQMRAALTAALPFLPVQGAVKKLEWVATGQTGFLETEFYAVAGPLMHTVHPLKDVDGPFNEHYSIRRDWNDREVWRVTYYVGNNGLSGISKACKSLEAAKAAAQADYSARILSALEPSAARERAWYFSAGDTVPEWLEKIEKGNCTLTFGVDVVVTSKDGGYEVRPQGIADNAGPILHVVNQGNVTPEIKGGGNGVAIIGYNRPYDETAGWRIARLKRLLEMARPYVECYDTREHNSEQDAVLTEIDKALSVVVGEPHADAGKVEGDGWKPIESAPKDGTIIHVWAEGYEWPETVKWVDFEDDELKAEIGADGYWTYADELLADVVDSVEPELWTNWRPLPSAPSEGAE